MAQFVRKSVESAIEGQIATASIISTEFLAKIDPIMNLDFLINPYVKTICRWCLDYFRSYNKAPFMNIKPIFYIEKHNLDPAEADLISTLLTSLNKKYVEDDGINDGYIFDKAKEHFIKREFDIKLEQVNRLRDANRIKDALILLNEPSKVEVFARRGIFPFTDEEVYSTYHSTKTELLSLPGALGKMLGPFERDWLVGIMGGFKKGKTMYLTEIGVRGLLSRKKVAFFSFEMNLIQMNKRWYRRVSGLGDEELLYYPIFDCQLNQLGICERSENRIAIRKKASDKITEKDYTEEYKTCSLCRGISLDYIPEVWYEPIKAPTFQYRDVKKKVKGFANMYGDENLMLWSYPRFSASIDDIRSNLDDAARFLDFIPDVVLVDYANIMRPAKGDSKEGVKAIDDIWKRLAGLAAERHALVVTGSQGTRASLKKNTKGEEDVPEWIGILGHVDMFLAINQNSDEKKKGMIRFNVLEHRHRNFNPDDEVIVLQKLDSGQTLLDSEYAR